jgi:VWFA-related protein
MHTKKLTRFFLSSVVSLGMAAGAPPSAPAGPDGGGQHSEIAYDPATRTVTIKLQVQDANGSFIPNIRRENFAVYEDGVRQNAKVEIEHAPVTLAVLMEWGGRYQAFNNALSEQVPRAAQQLLEELGRQDKAALFRYADRVEQIAGFTSGREARDGLFASLNRPEFSELNFYDALISTVKFMKNVSGRKAIVVLSSGIDTFSQATLQDALAAAREGQTPIYVIDIAPALRSSVDSAAATAGPYARIDWKRAESALRQIAQASGGRLYTASSTFDLSGIYDDLMEDLRVRYVLTYQSGAGGQAARTVRVELIDPASGGPLEIADAGGKTTPFRFSFEARYAPAETGAVQLAGTPEHH